MQIATKHKSKQVNKKTHFIPSICSFYEYLVSQVDEEGHLERTQEQISLEMGYTPPTIRLWLRELRDAGYIKYRTHDGVRLNTTRIEVL